MPLAPPSTTIFLPSKSLATRVTLRSGVNSADFALAVAGGTQQQDHQLVLIVKAFTALTSSPPMNGRVKVVS
jgi:hypothetical protein